MFATATASLAQSRHSSLNAEQAEAEAVHFLVDLVRIDTQDLSGDESKVAHYLEGVLKDAVETYHKTVILVTHDIDEAVALSKRVVVLSGRPARVKTVHDIDIHAPSPIAARSDGRFSGYFHSLCAELDIQTEKTA